MRGIILAGGSGSRLSPLTKVVSKQLLPVYNKPMIFYPLSTLMLMGIREILVISNPRYLPMFQELLGDGKSFGIDLQYAVQEKPNGIAEALIIGESFLSKSRCALILGDNLLYGPGLGRDLINKVHVTGATVLAHHVSDPSEFGVVTFDDFDVPIDIVEKPKDSASNWAIPGLYFYDSSAPEKAKQLQKSARGELEISQLNKLYLAEGNLNVLRMSRGSAWLDMGSPKLLLEAGNFIQIVEDRQGLEVGNPYQVASLMGFKN
jgi:glucose-1-phosphate thymidylyltransferase